MDYIAVLFLNIQVFKGDYCQCDVIVFEDKEEGPRSEGGP